MKPTINSDKHIVHFPTTVVASGARTNFLVLDVDNDFTNAGSVRQGASVKAVYIEMWIDGVTASKTAYGAVIKLVSAVAALTYTEILNMGTYANKKNVLSQHQGLAPSGGNIVPLFREWVLIPKGKQRMGKGDSIKITISATGTNVNVCGFAVFKEYF